MVSYGSSFIGVVGVFYNSVVHMFVNFLSLSLPSVSVRVCTVHERAQSVTQFSLLQE